MNVFVLCTGRSGSMSFAKACSHFTNLTSGHETRTQIIGPGRLLYPENHIEVDNHLSMQLGCLDMRYGDRACYVHLLREREAVAQSFARLISSPYSNVRAFAAGVLMRPHLKDEDILPACLDYVDTVTANIRAFLKDKSLKFTVQLECPHESFDAFASAIGAKGDLVAAHEELNIRHNQKKNAPYLRKQNTLRRLFAFTRRSKPFSSIRPNTEDVK